MKTNFLRILLATPASTPRAALAWDCGAVKMKFRIMERKLNFLNYILKQNHESLANQILHEQKKNNFPGLVQECYEFIQELNIPDPFQQSFSRNQWRRLVKAAIRSANTQELQAEIAEYKKLKHSELVNEEFGRKEYIEKLSIHQARIKFKFRSADSRKQNNSFHTLGRCEDYMSFSVVLKYNM